MEILNKTVLVTGATGLIGSNLVEKLMSMETVRVIALARSADKIKNVFAKHIGNDHFRYVVQDVSEPIEHLDERIHAIFHAAGPIAGSIIKNSPLDVIWPNIYGTRNCLNYLRWQERQHGVKGRLVMFSSATIYGNSLETERVVCEEDTIVTGELESITAPYFEAKRMAEVISLSYWRQYGIDVVIGRLGYVYGYTQFRPNTAFYEFINKALCGENIIINNTVFDKRDNIYVDDAVDGMICLCEKGEAGKVYNISSNGELHNYKSVDEMAESIAHTVNGLCGERVKVIFSKPVITRKYAVRMDNSKLKALGWKLTTSMETGITEIIHMYQENERDML